MIVSILGSGVMGGGIVSLILQATCVSQVKWWSRNKESTAKSLPKVRKVIDRYCKKNKLNSEAILSKLNIVNSIGELSDSHLYIEAISENLDSKADLIQEVSQFASAESVFATNTSSLSITALSMNFTSPEQFVGMHFFNPTSRMELVEIVKGLNTSDATVDYVKSLSLTLGKSPVLVQESPGFIVNRMLIPMINEGVSILAEGIAAKEDIDNAMRLGAHHPLGPLSLADLIGNDVCLSIMESLHKETGDPKYRAHTLLRQYVRAGLLGRKSGRGFYDYS